MTRHFAIGRLAGLLLLGAWGASASWLSAQDDVFAPSSPPKGRADRAALAVPDLRIKNGDPRTAVPIDPKIEAILVKWSERTKEIKRIQGSHLRAVLDFTFGTDTRAQGQFYVETPDKGRIDMEKYTGQAPKVGQQHTRLAPNGEKKVLTVQVLKQPERWVCNGKEIVMIDDRAKTYDVVPIPPEQRGENIIDGPLPFLFGMPPEKAKARYHFRLPPQKENTTTFWIQILPKMAKDAAEWCRADLFLNRETYLPEEVHLVNPARTTETIYLFHGIQVNKQILFPFFPGADPFKPVLTRYKKEVHATPAGPNGPMQGPVMPRFVGRSFKEIKKLVDDMKQMGYVFQFEHGTPAPQNDLKFHVERQQPPPRTPLRNGQTIQLTFFDEPIERNQKTSKVPTDSGTQ